MNITCHHSSSRGNLYQVDDLLIDPGVPLKEIKRCLGFRLSGIRGALVSHAHGDHSKGVRDLLKSGIDCYMSQETAGALQVNGHRVKIFKESVPFQIGNYRVFPLKTVHDVLCFGFMIIIDSNRLLYINDTHYCPWKLRGLTHIMIGVNYDMGILRRNVQAGLVDLEVAKRTIFNHMSLTTAMEFFRANDMSRVQEIHLLHLSDDNSDAEMFRVEVQKTTGRPVYVAPK